MSQSQYEGMLWIDTDPKRPLEEKVLRAITHCFQKYGAKAAKVLVHRSVIASDEPVEVNGVKVGTSKTVSYPGQFFVVMREIQAQ